MADWGNIPSEIATVIAEHLEIVEDFEAFALVCSSWRRGAKEGKFEAKPWLMLPRHKEGGSNQRRFYSLYNRKVRTANLPLWNFQGYQVMLFSSHGWLLSVTGQGNNLFLLNPMSGAKINLPKVTYLISNIIEYRDYVFNAMEFQKFILSGNPSSSSDFTIALVMTDLNYHCDQIVCFWRDGYERWQSLLTEKGADVTFYKGNFYGITWFKCIYCYELDQSTGRPHRRIVAKLDPTGIFGEYLLPRDSCYYSTSRHSISYLVESENRLLLVIRVRALVLDEGYGYQTVFFKVYELNVNNGEAKHVPNLGDVGWNSSFSTKASSFAHGIKHNSIYFTGDYRIDGEVDVGIFTMADDNIHQLDGIIKPAYQYEHAPYVWLQDPSL